MRRTYSTWVMSICYFFSIFCFLFSLTYLFSSFEGCQMTVEYMCKDPEHPESGIDDYKVCSRMTDEGWNHVSSNLQGFSLFLACGLAVVAAVGIRFPVDEYH